MKQKIEIYDLENLLEIQVHIQKGSKDD